MTNNEEIEVNYFILVGFMLTSLPVVVESLVETGQEITTNAITTELNKINQKYQFTNVFVQTFIDNLSSNSQSNAMIKLMAMWLAINNLLNANHWLALKMVNGGKDLLGLATSKIAKGKLKEWIVGDKTQRANLMQKAIANRTATWHSSGTQAATHVNGSSLSELSKNDKMKNFKIDPSAQAIKDLFNFAGVGEVQPDEGV